MKPNVEHPAASPATTHDAQPIPTPPVGGQATTPPFTDGTLLDKRGVAALLGCSPRTVDQLMQQRKLPFCRITRKLVRFNRADVIAHIRERFGISAKGGGQ